MIYLDNSATTKPCKAAVQAMHEALENGWFNPSAAYGPAVRAEKRMWEARELLANAVGAKPDWLVFTASGSEADSLAILGSAARFHGGKRVLLFAGEHPAVLRTKAQLEAMGPHGGNVRRGAGWRGRFTTACKHVGRACGVAELHAG